MIFHLTSKKPVLLIGNGVRSAGASHLVYDFIEKTKIPALTTMNAVDLVQDKYRIGFIGTYGNRVANMILNECDFVISVGARLGLRQIGHKKELFAPNAKLVRVDIDQYELGRQIKDDEEVYPLDAKDFMERLLEEDIPSFDIWNKKCFEAKELLEGYDDLEGNLCIKKRFTDEKLAEINEMIIKNNKHDDDNTPPDSNGDNSDNHDDAGNDNDGTLIIDASCAPQNIAFPQDVNLLNEARENLEEIIISICYVYNLKRPRMYRKNARKDYLSLAKSKKRSAKKDSQSTEETAAVHTP